MWDQSSFEEKTKKIESALNNPSRVQSDSGFLSYNSVESSMKASGIEKVDLELSESFIRNLSLKCKSINNLETIRTQNQSSPIVGSMATTTVSWTNARWNEMFRSEILRHPYQFFVEQDDDGDTQLHITIIMGQLDATFLLIGLVPHPSLLDISNNNSHTALHVAVLLREARIVRRLVLAGAHLRCWTSLGNTPLHLACIHGDLACVRALTEPLSPEEKLWLVSNGNGQSLPTVPQYLEIQNFDGKTSLHIATMKGHANIVDHLLRVGANIDTQEGLAGKTALHLAVENGFRHIVHLLVNHRPTCVKTAAYDGTTAYEMIQDSNCQLAEELLRFGSWSDSDSGSDNGANDQPLIHELDKTAATV